MKRHIDIVATPAGLVIETDGVEQISGGSSTYYTKPMVMRLTFDHINQAMAWCLLMGVTWSIQARP